MGVATFELFSNPRTFPTLKRSTGASLCLFISFSLSATAPLVAELPAPIPIIVVFTLSLIGLGCSFLFASDESEDNLDYENKKQD